jgi:hypothetical protein
LSFPRSLIVAVFTAIRPHGLSIKLDQTRSLQRTIAQQY